MIYVFMQDVYSLPFKKNQDAKEVLGGQEGSHVRGQIYVFWSICALDDAPYCK